jgi:hypothetical protein
VVVVVNSVEDDRLDGFVIGIGLWLIVLGLMLWVERTDAGRRQ